MDKGIEELIADMKAAAEKATSGEWWSDVVECDGTYGNGDECAEGFHSYAVYDSNNQTLLDMTNSTAACIQVDCDDESHYAWDEVAERNAEYIVLARPENVLALIAALEQAQHDLNAANGLIKKIKSNSWHVDTSEGAFIPNSLDAWGRPVPQYLPYDFSGNPGASATQYCNGWNDSGGYWLNHVRDLEEAAMERPEAAPSGMMQLSNELAEMKRRCVELPENVIAEVCLAAAEIHNRGCGVDDDKAQFIIDRIRMYLSNGGIVEGSA